MSAYGSSAGTMLQYAAHAITTGQANVVACLYADAPLSPGGSISQSAYNGRGIGAGTGFASLRFAYGDYGPANTSYALACRRHMHLYGTTHDQLGTIAVGQRAWAQLNPQAQMYGKPMTLDDYHDSRWIVEPLHLLDCCLVSNGAVAVIVTSAERARDLRAATGLPARLRSGRRPATTSAPAASRPCTPAPSARVSWRCGWRTSRSRTSTCSQLYDCYTYTVLVTLEDYGFCAKGEGGAFVADGKLGPGGSLPTNTGGGQLSSFYMWGFTPLSEGVIQARGQGGERQVPEARPRAGQRQRRHAQLALDDGPGGVMAGLVETPSKPVPVPDEASRPFFDGARRGVLLLRRCGACGTFMSPTGGLGTPLRPRCIGCFSADLEWAPAGGRGTLYSFALMHQVYDPAFADEVPYNIAVVELDEGVRMTTNVVGCANEELWIGMPLVVTFEQVSEEVAIPKFRRST